MHCLNMILVLLSRCALISGSKSISMVNLNLHATSENKTMFVKVLFIVKHFEWYRCNDSGVTIPSVPH